jgi:hypothetical protein
MDFFSNVVLPLRKHHYHNNHPPTHTGFRAFKNYGFLPWLGLLVYCHQGCLTYLVVMALAPLRKMELELQTLFYLSLCNLSVS